MERFTTLHSHVLRVASERPTVDDFTQPSNKETPVLAAIRLWSRYILISN